MRARARTRFSTTNHSPVTCQVSCTTGHKNGTVIAQKWHGHRPRFSNVGTTLDPNLTGIRDVLKGPKLKRALLALELKPANRGPGFRVQGLKFRVYKSASCRQVSLSKECQTLNSLGSRLPVERFPRPQTLEPHTLNPKLTRFSAPCRAVSFVHRGGCTASLSQTPHSPPCSPLSSSLV
jgi:hypothetical protein